MKVLGISAHYHDSAAAIVDGGVLVAAAQEERFTRVRHDAAFPTRAIGACLDAAGLGEQDLDAVIFYDKPLLKLERILVTHAATWPLSLPSFGPAPVSAGAGPGWVGPDAPFRGPLTRARGCTSPCRSERGREPK